MTSTIRIAGALAVACTLTACGEPSVPAAPDAAVTPDSGPSCPEHTHVTPEAGCDSTLTFAESTAIPLARDHHGTAIVDHGDDGAWLIVAGGFDGAATTDSVAIAPIEAEGAIGAFREGLALPAPRAGLGIAIVGDHVVLAGGRDASFLASTLVGRLQPDGSIASWTAGPDLPEARFHGAGVAVGRRVYVSGGLHGISTASVAAQPDVWSAELADDGSLGSWRTEVSLPEPTSHHAVLAHDGSLYVVGGLGGNPFTGEDEPRLGVYRASVGADGVLAPWERLVAELARPASTHSALIVGARLYLFGGVSGSANTDAIQRARLAEDGTLEPFEVWSTSLPAARAHLHQAPFHAGRAYFVSGSMSPHTPVAVTWVATFE